jgi:hypothetical protein
VRAYSTCGRSKPMPRRLVEKRRAREATGYVVPLFSFGTNALLDRTDIPCLRRFEIGRHHQGKHPVTSAVEINAADGRQESSAGSIRIFAP